MLGMVICNWIWIQIFPFCIISMNGMDDSIYVCQFLYSEIIALFWSKRGLFERKKITFSPRYQLCTVLFIECIELYVVWFNFTSLILRATLKYIIQIVRLYKKLSRLLRTQCFLDLSYYCTYTQCFYVVRDKYSTLK